MFFIIQCNLKIWISILILRYYIINKIYLIFFQLILLVILKKRNIWFVTKVLEQPGSAMCVHKVVVKYEWRKAIINKKESYRLMLTLIRKQAWHFNVLHREMQAARNFSFFNMSKAMNWECKFFQLLIWVHCLLMIQIQNAKHKAIRNLTWKVKCINLLLALWLLPIIFPSIGVRPAYTWHWIYLKISTSLQYLCCYIKSLHFVLLMYMCLLSFLRSMVNTKELWLSFLVLDQ